MHSDYLNEDKICQMFQEDADSGNKKQQISLNFTVTSRQSRSIPGANSNQNPKTQQHHNNNHNPSSYSWQNNSSYSSIDSLKLAQKQLDKFNSWMSTLTKSSQQLIDDLDELTSFAQNNRSTALSMTDFQNIRKYCTKNLNKNDKIIYNSDNQKVCDRKNDYQCQKCKKNQEIIKFIEQQYNIKVQECLSYAQQLNKYQKMKQQFDQQIQRGIRDSLLQGVQINILREQNQSLASQVITLKMEIDKSKLQKSCLMQKSSSLLKTKQLLQKKLQSTNNLNLNFNSNYNSNSSNMLGINSQIMPNTTNSSNMNIKLFSNAKNSTNALNPNDTINRVDSIMYFGDSEPNYDELIKYYTQQIQIIKDKIRQNIIQQQRRRNVKFGKQQRQAWVSETMENKLMNMYKTTQMKLIQIKMLKDKCPSLFTSIGKQRKSQQIQSLNIKIIQQNDQIRRSILVLQKKIKGMQIQNQNLQQTNADLKQQLNRSNRKISEISTYHRQTQQQLLMLKEQYGKIMQAQKNESQQRKRLSLEIQQLKGSIRVYCRVRPKIGVQMRHKTVIHCQENKIIKDGKQYQFDHVFNQRNQQKDVYKQIRPLVQHAYDGKNLCILTYGQTGSGKTYTMHGNDKNPGLAYNIMNDIYQFTRRDRNIFQFNTWMTSVQIYKEQIRDLIFKNKLQIKQNSVQGVYLDDLKPIRFTNKQQMLQIYKNGISSRTTGQMDMNSDSSRSHLIMTFQIQKTCRKSRQKKISKITLVDLAGAQKLTNSNPIITKQTQFINKSLSCLISVLSALRSKNEHIPYRDSKLTYLLKQSLTTKCNVLTFINISSSEINSLQTNNSLAFGVKARTVQRVHYYGKSREKQVIKQKQNKDKDNKQNQKNRRSSHRLSMNSQSLRNL